MLRIGPLAATAVLVVLASGVVGLQVPGPAGPSSELPALLDVSVVDGSGRAITALTPRDLRVALDGKPKQIRSVVRVFRGADALEAARDALALGPVAVVASRIVVIAVDESTIERGREKTVASGVWRVIDGLTPADRIGVVALPVPRGRTLLTDDREPVRPSRIAC